MKWEEHGGRVIEISTSLGDSSQQWLDFSANINPLGLTRR